MRVASKVGVVLTAVALSVPIGAAGASVHADGSSGAVKSKIGAGHLVSPAAGVHSAEAQFRVPKITCARADDLEALWLGISAFEGTAGAGDNDLYAQVRAACVYGRISYLAEVAAPGTRVASIAVAAGDLIDVAIHGDCVKPGCTAATVQRIATGTTTQLLNVTGTAPTNAGGVEQSVLFGQQGLILAVPNFVDSSTGSSSVYFVATWLNGSATWRQNTPAVQLHQANHHTEIKSSTLGTPKGQFRLSFVSNY